MDTETAQDRLEVLHHAVLLRRAAVVLERDAHGHAAQKEALLADGAHARLEGDGLGERAARPAR